MLKKNVQDMIARIPNLSDSEKEKLFLKIVAACEEGPDTILDFVGHGSFKECYKLNDDYVIKFCSCANPTEQERFLLEAAARYGVIDIFLPSYFCPLGSNTVPMTYLEDDRDYDWREDEEGVYYRYYYTDEESSFTVGNYLIIQPKAEEACYRPRDIPRKPIPDSYGFYLITSRDWCEAVCGCYGEEFFDKLNAFVQEYQIWDLSGNNIGYFNGKPCIFDWMTDRRLEKEGDLVE